MRKIVDVPEKICEHCGGTFAKAVYGGKLESKGNFTSRKYCCRECSNLAKRKYERDYYQQHQEDIRRQKRENMLRYRRANPEKHRQLSRDAKAKLKGKVWEMYGHTCSACGFPDKRALSLDHVKNNGAKERRELGERGVYQRAIEAYRPDDYRILCMNCQFIKRHEAGRENQHGISSVSIQEGKHK